MFSKKLPKQLKRSYANMFIVIVLEGKIMDEFSCLVTLLYTFQIFRN